VLGELMADIASVEIARKSVSKAYNKWLVASFNRKMSELGSQKRRDELQPVNSTTGVWEDDNKPPGWLVHLARNGDAWTAIAPRTRFSGALNMQGQTNYQGIYFRVFPMVKSVSGEWELHPYWEWSIAVVLPGPPAAWRDGSTGTVLDFDAPTGELSAHIQGTKRPQNYVDAGLFGLIDNPFERWSATVDLTYRQATDALEAYITVECVEPTTRADERE
jgi:hypothetical protein